MNERITTAAFMDGKNVNKTHEGDVMLTAFIKNNYAMHQLNVLWVQRNVRWCLWVIWQQISRLYSRLRTGSSDPAANQLQTEVSQ